MAGGARFDMIVPTQNANTPMTANHPGHLDNALGALALNGWTVADMRGDWKDAEQA
jgi:hypothetical protein